FDLYQTYGFPLELTKEMAGERGLVVDEEGFAQAFAEHQEKSRAGLDKKFAGGLADQSETVTKYHTATHLLHSALRQVLGEQVQQKGSNITPERLRFDFSHPEKLTDEEIKQVEDLVNQKIKENLPVEVETMSLAKAEKQGALAFFGQKYGDQVKVYSIGSFSGEVCGGPHVGATGKLGKFKILKEKSVGRGLRRIRAVLKSSKRKATT
ncbi:alanine--tRNA ligase-related protein, partial [Candidatus Parcubacteria bacterium]|nr:alanine--tRNA ligase-related protein [Candidatus Parcubacteria bacterium]